MTEKDEFQRVLNQHHSHLEGQIWGHAPVQAEGTIEGREFYFRARGDEWTFAVAEVDEADPADICCSDQGFFRQGIYGKAKDYDASYMPYDEAERLIRICAQEFLSFLNSHP